MYLPRPIVIDFETDGIQSRPKYPPRPVGFSIKHPGDRKSTYYAWGHPSGNNCDLTNAKRILNQAWRSGQPLLFHNAKFDYDVATTHMDCPELPWERIHDTLYLMFLNDPHAESLGLKQGAEKLLGIAPDERDSVELWVKKNIKIDKGRRWGFYISQVPGDIVGRYANGDVMRTEKLFIHLYPLVQEAGMSNAYNRERQLMPIFLANERQGLRVDVEALERDIPVYTKARESADAWLRRKLKAPDMNLDSDAEVAAALDKLGIVKEWTLTKTGKKSVSKKNLFIDQFSDPRVFYMLGYRNRMGTCLNMFMETWLEKAQRTGGVINPNWNQVRQAGSGDSSKGTRTGRPSCADPNLLNLSKSFEDRGDDYTHPKFFNTPELPLVRRYVLPDKGEEWGHRDFNQQELRILAHYEDDAILKAYNENPGLDIHTFVQSEIKRLMKRDLDRVSVKTMNFGKLYGQGMDSLAKKLGVTVKEVKVIRDSQNRALPGLKELEEDIKACAKKGRPIITWGGRVYYCEPPSYVERFGRKMTFEYKLLNYLVQGSAADATKEAIIRYEAQKARRSGRFLVTVYDEINFSAPPKAMKDEMRILRECMEGLEFDVPMLSDAKVGPNWGTLTKYKE